MFLKRPERLGRSTAYRLTFWYTLVFITSWLGLFAAGYTIMDTSIRSKDQQIVTGMLDKYDVIASSQGIDQLLAHLKNEQLAHISGGYFVMVKAQGNQGLHLSLPYEWRAVPQSDITDKLIFSNNDWVTLSTRAYLPAGGGTPRHDELEILGRELKDGTILYVGFSTESREDFLEQFRNIFLLIMGPVVVLSILIGTQLARRALKPVRDLSKAVEQVQSGRMDTRVPIQGTNSELKVLAGQFNTMLERIECLIDGMREALDNVAHDLRTPLMRMRSAIETSVVSEDSDKLREALLDCAEESERISTMLTALMDISEAETGVMKLNYSSFRLADLMHEIEELFLYSAEEKNITIKVNMRPDLIVYADYPRLRQVLCNLIDNAMKYTSKNGWVCMHAEENGPILTLSLQDNGIGISPDDAPRIFERLYRGDKSRAQKGLGLGLSLVKAVVQAHKGTIDVKSRPGEGTTFLVSLPHEAKSMKPLPPANRG